MQDIEEDSSAPQLFQKTQSNPLIKKSNSVNMMINSMIKLCMNLLIFITKIW